MRVHINVMPQLMEEQVHLVLVMKWRERLAHSEYEEGQRPRLSQGRRDSHSPRQAESIAIVRARAGSARGVRCVVHVVHQNQGRPAVLER